ncbi:unnamed protein product [Eruca vesicaria subsp. sativa]|uniref:Fe2OG dioxygenase domain-containing protein n=1 Tax=Eruca vesicaria subsp. sativa TaxID=29727 RepID=A0ABC8K287_ERUVS|nr:unnamed protein product [Eruca vesicaria subsp. sativa]
MGGLDEAFIQAPEHRPKTDLKNSGDYIYSNEIPTIDLSSLQDPDCDKTALATEIAEACMRWGFFQVVNHGLSLDLKRRVEKTMADFFSLTSEEKRRVKRDEVNPMGVGRHADAGVITVLAQDNVGGLQVWTNDKYWSAEHRVVVNSSKERFSMPFFLFPSHEVNIEPLKELLSEDNPPCYKKYNWGKFYVARNRSDYKKLQTENIQIDRFKAA